MKLVKIKDNPYLLKDQYSKAILNTNRDEIKKYVNDVKDKRKINEMERQIDTLKKQLNSLASLLLKNRE